LVKPQGTTRPSIRTYLKSLQRWLEVDLEAALERLTQLELFKLAPFSFEEEELKVIGEAFGEFWSTGICHIMSTFIPYADVITIREADGSFSREFQNWFFLRERAKADGTSIGKPARDLEEYLSYVEQRAESPIPRALFEQELERIEGRKGSSLAFSVVFQRGMLLAYLDFARVLQDFVGGEGDSDEGILDDIFDEIDELDEIEDEVEEGDGVEEEEASGADGSAADESFEIQYFERAKQFTGAMNKIVLEWPELLNVGGQIKAVGNGNVYIWAGSLRNPAGSIDFTQAASNRARDLILLLVGMIVFVEAFDEGNRPGFGDYWAELENPDSSLFKVLRSRLNLWSKETGAGGRRLKERDWPYDAQKARDEMFGILERAWELVDL
jgi:hypothetical protein